MAAGAVVISLFRDGPTVRLEKKLKHPYALMKRIGRILERESKNAFALQRFGTIKWEPRYPNQKAPKLNIAGALMDLGKGPSVKARRYEDRPALYDRGFLKRSIKAGPVTGLGRFVSVEVGTNLNYAQKQHAGGISRIPITSAMRTNYSTLIGKMKKKLDKATGQKKLDAAGQFWPLKKHIGPILANQRVTVYDVNVVARPFIGVTDAALQDIKAAIIADFVG